MASNTQHNVTGADAPADLAVAISPSDSTDLPNNTRAIYVGGAGNITCIMACDVTNSGAGTNVVFTAVPVGTILPICVCRVKATGTTATNLVALY